VVERSFGLTELERQQAWVLRAQGLSLRAIARELGVWRSSLGRYVSASGGVRPRARRRAPGCLSAGEREEISRGLAAGESFRCIARRIGRSHSTVCREVARNGGRQRYRAGQAESAAWDRARRPKPSKLGSDARLRAVVEDKLACRWSPEQVSGWLARTYPEDREMRVSHETIYVSLFVQSRGALRRELTAYLRSGRKMRRPRQARQKGQGRGQIRDMVMISDRPAEISDRAVPGHWEGDLLLGRRPTAIATLVERTSRYVQLVALPDGYRAGPVRQALSASVQTLPVQLARSLTWDQGHEMAEHAQFTVATGVQVYFCDPNSPWQRATNENTNGLLRQYFPARKPLPADQADLDEVAAQLNGRPRKTLGFMTPAERYTQLLSASQDS
jgi:IS30 family transposase